MSLLLGLSKRSDLILASDVNYFSPSFIQLQEEWTFILKIFPCQTILHIVL